MQATSSVPAHPELDPRHPLVVFGDHRFCAGHSLDVKPMAGPHMHSQIELNFVLDGQMTYWYDGRELTLDTGRLILFWGMVPHQVTDCAANTRFVCLYVPMSVFLGFARLHRFRDAVFRGAMIEALTLRPYDREVFLRWRDELLTEDGDLTEIVRNELTARVLRIEREGWRDLREDGSAIPGLHHGDAERIGHIERMLQFIAANALGAISADDVARHARSAPELRHDAVPAERRPYHQPVDRPAQAGHCAVLADLDGYLRDRHRLRVRFRFGLTLL